MKNLASFLLRKRVILGLVTGTVVFATTLGAAATLGIGSSSLGAGNIGVAACDDSISTSYTTSYDAALPGYKVSGVTVTGIDAACNNKSVSVTLTGSDNTVLASASGAFSSAGANTLKTFSSSDLSAQPTAASVVNVHAVIAG